MSAFASPSSPGCGCPGDDAEVTTNVLTLSGGTITSAVNGVAASVNISPAVLSAIFSNASAIINVLKTDPSLILVADVFNVPLYRAFPL